MEFSVVVNVLKGIIFNREFPSLIGESLEITRTVPLIEIQREPENSGTTRRLLSLSSKII